MIRSILGGLAFTALTLAALAGTASPASAREAVASSIRLDQASPALGGQITFTSTYPTKVKSPRISVRCYQGGKMGFAEAGTYNHVFVLGGGASIWKTSGGPASCTAELFYFIWNGNNSQQVVSLATTSFNAAG